MQTLRHAFSRPRRFKICESASCCVGAHVRLGPARVRRSRRVFGRTKPNGESEGIPIAVGSSLSKALHGVLAPTRAVRPARVTQPGTRFDKTKPTGKTKGYQSRCRRRPSQASTAIAQTRASAAQQTPPPAQNKAKKPNDI